MASSDSSERAARNEVLQFFRAWLANPRLMGAVLPSSAALGSAITAEITPKSAPVIELGPGTGVFTRALLERGVPENKVALLENEPKLAHLLRIRFPAARVLCTDAARLKHIEPFDGEPAGAVLSGLPLLSIPPATVTAILEGAFVHLRPEAVFYQFTYVPRCPVPRSTLEKLGLTATRTGLVFGNLPPAFIYRIERQPAKPRHPAAGTQRTAKHRG